MHYNEKPYQAYLDQPIWIFFFILSHLVDFKLIRIFAWHSLGHSERPYLTFNYHAAFVEVKFIYFGVYGRGILLPVWIKENRRKGKKSLFGCLHFVCQLLPFRCIFMKTVSVHPPLKANKSQAIRDWPLSASLTTFQTYTFNIPLIEWFLRATVNIIINMPLGPGHILKNLTDQMVNEVRWQTSVFGYFKKDYYYWKYQMLFSNYDFLFIVPKTTCSYVVI